MKIFPLARLLLCFGFLSASLFAQSGKIAGSQSGLDLSAIDKSADPCQDFYQYACGSWMRNNPIPADQSSWGTFDQLYERNQKELRAILEESQQHQDRSAIDGKIGGFYQSCMDEATIEKRGTDPLQSELERISRISNQQDLLDETARLHERQVGVFFTFDATPDPKNAKMTIADMDQGGIGLPEKDFYFRTDAKSQEIRQKYVTHIGKMLSLIGVPAAEAATKARVIKQIETDLAKASLDVTSRRNPQLRVHEMSRIDLQKLTPAFQFNQFFTR